MMGSNESPDLQPLLEQFSAQADQYFASAAEVVADNTDHSFARDYYWNLLTPEMRNEGLSLVVTFVKLAGRISSFTRNAPLVSDADQQDIVLATKAIRAAILLRKFRSWNANILHDENRVLGVTPAGQEDDWPLNPTEARQQLSEGLEKIGAALELAAASRSLGANDQPTIPTSTRIRPGTAFIMMSMDPARPELADVADAVKTVFGLFDVRAVRADDIEHEGLITQRILDEIKTAEFCFADLTGERPNVYYEVGYAHALGRRVILFRKSGTGIHFDLAGYNCPAYANLVDLKERLTRRLEEMTNRRAGSA